MSLDEAPATELAAVPGQRPAPAATPPAGSRRDRRRAERRDRAGGPLSAALLVALPAAAALASCLHDIGERQMWRDEQASWWASTLSIGDLSKLIHNVDIVLLPYYLFLHGWIDLFGDSPTALRVPSAIAMAVAAGWLALLGRRLFTPATGLLAGLLLAVLPSTTRYGQEARPYAFAVLVAIASTHLLVRALDRPSLKSWVGYAVTIPLLGWTHLVTLSVLAGHLAAVLTRTRRADLVPRWAFTAAVLAGGSLTVPMVLQGRSQSAQIAWNKTGPADLKAYPDTLFLSWHVGLAVLAVGLLGLLAARRHAALLAAWALLPPLVTFATASWLHLFLNRYLLFTLPAWTLLAAAAVCRVGGPLTSGAAPALPRRLLSWVLVAAAVAGLGWTAWPGIRATHQDLAGEPDYNRLTRIMLHDQQPGDGIVYSGTLQERMSMAYELRDVRTAPKDILLQKSAAEIGLYSAQECDDPDACAANTNRIWLVATGPAADPLAALPPQTAQVLRSQFQTTRTDSLPWVRLVLLSRVHPSRRASVADDLGDHNVQMAPGSS
ncbi:glycosyltransferase family 39 protein [Kitasatospora sp. NBC_01287]|uniref:glycosyltransferase family 39 protein n=1 Tax=Kitasatospora sp. NBC_01287 TaxID=2903573 RepID=UPI00225434B6|nr:glycosyltransferase family 39 protein [Kitasatospora sp. NBC_01287]MCX4746836.1 glycosyltransferase family 39 protein [Kitasatospora sp. NBC_01287]